MKKLSLSFLTTLGLTLGASGVRADDVAQGIRVGSPTIETGRGESDLRTFIGHRTWGHHLALWKAYCSLHPYHYFCSTVVAQPQPKPQPQPAPQPQPTPPPPPPPPPPSVPPQMPDDQPWPPSDEPADEPAQTPDPDQKYPIPLPPPPTADEPWPSFITVDGKEYPICSSSKLDADKDGWGWQNNQTCIVYVMPCSSPAVDPDGDGWGWENEESCSVWR